MGFFNNLVKNIFNIPDPISSCSDLSEQELFLLKREITRVIANYNRDIRFKDIFSSFMIEGITKRIFDRKVLNDQYIINQCLELMVKDGTIKRDISEKKFFDDMKDIYSLSVDKRRDAILDQLLS